MITDWIHSGTGSPLLLLPKLRSLLLVMVAVVTSNIQATTTNVELSDGSTAERREWNVKPIVCESVPYHVLWKRLQMDIMQNSGSIYNVRMSSNGTVIYDLKPRVRRNSLTPKLAEAEDQGLLGDANAKELRNAHNLRKSRRISSNLRVRNASRKSFKIKRSDSHVAAEGNSGDRNQWLNSAYESFKQFLQNFRVWEDQNQNRVYFEQLASRLRQNLCQFQSRRIQLSDGYFPPTVTSGRCRKLDPKAKCLATKYSVQLLKKAENLCYPVPSTTANSTYEEVWVMTSIKVNVGCQTVFTRHG